MDTTPKELSYFSLRLQELLTASFPELATNKTFINRRSQLAANAYEGAFTAGNPIDHCNEIADYILFEGLHFSRYDTLFKVVCNEFDTLMADEELRYFALRMMPVCEHVFLEYDLSEDLTDKTEFELLYTELTGNIQIWIEENGLQ